MLIKMKLLLIFTILILADRDTYPINVASDYASAKLLQSEINTEFIMLTEIFKPIEGYKNLYEISNLGNVRSSYLKGKMRKLLYDTNGYCIVALWSGEKYYTKLIHHLVWDAFGDKPRNGRKLQVDHIDNSKRNNRIDNLQLLTNRENVSKGFLQNGKKEPTGVSFKKAHQKYYAQIRINKKLKHLGCYETAEEASSAYQKELGALI